MEKNKAIKRQKGELAEIIYNLNAFGLHVPSRTLKIGDIDSEEADLFSNNMRILESISHDPINIEINSNGGCSISCLSICDRMSESPCFITIKGMGLVCSAATIIFQCADKRILSKNTCFMIHYGSVAMENTVVNAKRWGEYYKKDDKKMENLFLAKIQEKNPKFQLKQLQKMLEHDTILDPEEVVKLNLADEIQEYYNA